MPSTLENKLIIDYNNKKVKVDIYDTPLGKRFVESLKDNLVKKRILEKNFCFFCITRVNTVQADLINTYDLLNSNHLLITQEGFKKIEEITKF